MKKDPFVSIIIPLGEKSGFIEECLRNCLKQSYKNFELIVLPDKKIFLGALGKKARVVPTGKIGPAEKRDIGIKIAKGEICAFIDDDVFPARGWLGNAVRLFAGEKIAAVCGPAVTPDSDSLMQQASGAVFSSVLCSGSAVLRYAPRQEVFVDDFPSCNLLVKKKALLEVGCFNSNYYPGEDTKLCLELVKKGRKILYSPKVLVFHHRRRLFLQHLKQVKEYALHRGFFVKNFAANSLRMIYFLPALFVLYLIFGAIFSFFNQGFFMLFAGSLFLYFAAAFAFAGSDNLLVKFVAAIGTFLTHIIYGIFFVSGLAAKRLKK